MPKIRPTPMVTAIAKAPQTSTRIVAGNSGAPPARAPTAPRIASATSVTTSTTGITIPAGASTAAASGTAAAMAKVTSEARMLLTLDVRDEAGLEALRMELGDEFGTGEVLATFRTGLGADPKLRLGRSFHLDGELAERLASVPGLAKVELTTRRGGSHLRLVA